MRVGVSPVLLSPRSARTRCRHTGADHTWAKVVFDPWRQETWDASDTVLVGDPSERRRCRRADRAAATERVFADMVQTAVRRRDGIARAGCRSQGRGTRRDARRRPLRCARPHIHHRRIQPVRAVRPDDPGTLRNAQRARHHGECPGGTRRRRAAGRRAGPRGHADRLRPRRESDPRVKYGSRRALDARRRREQVDPRLGSSRGHGFRMAYDALRRPTGTSLSDSGGPEQRIGGIIYGEARGDAFNQRGRVYQQMDQAGVVTHWLYGTSRQSGRDDATACGRVSRDDRRSGSPALASDMSRRAPITTRSSVR